jgi:uncharacterized protein YecT (DUF1311 family)
MLFAAVFWSETNSGAQTQMQLNAEACGRSKKADEELTRVSKQILADNASDGNFVKAFAKAQDAWVAFRDAQVTAVFPGPSPMAYGSSYAMCRCGVLEQLTTERTKELRKLWIEGVEEGDVCVGSCTVKHR